jgi:peroxiredoxin/mono/diheme cytochrome c family protein
MGRRFLCWFALLTFAASATAGDMPIGARTPDLAFKDIRYVNRSLNDFPKTKAFVIVFVDAGCPLAQRYLPTLQQIDADYRDKSVVVLAVNSGPDSIPATAAMAVRHNCTFPFVKDFDAVCARALGVTRTPECVVLDADRKLRYRGRIDDQYRPTGSRPAPTTRELRDALDAVLAGKDVVVTTTPVDGCPITRPAPPEMKGVTFATDVASILKAHCQECHRPGTVAPFALQTYEQVKARAKAIADVVTDGRMPPWRAAPEQEFVNHRGLSVDERDTLLAWLRSPDRPPGNDTAAPIALPPAGEWRIGSPDFVVTAAEHALPAAGDVPYQYALLPTLFLHDTWVQAIEIKSDNPRVLHHCNMAYVKPGEKFSVTNFVTGQVPGGTPMTLDNGVAFKIPAGSLLILQIHYVTTGKPEKCKVSVGLRYARETVQQQLHLMYLATNRFAIPPFASAHPVSVTRTMPCDAIGVGLFVHMHLRGKDMTFRAKYPEGGEEELLLVPNFSFDWQQPYRWAPGGKKLPKGTQVQCVAHYDNSAFNPFNPDPTVTVRDGPQTRDEMMNGFLFYVDANEKLGLAINAKSGRVKDVP